MWIRSQDRERLFNVEKFVYRGYENIEEKHQIRDITNDVQCGDRLGVYKNKERCLGVLDEIQEHIFHGRDKSFYYQMPKE